MNASTKRSPLILVAALAGALGLISPALASPELPSTPATDPLPPPPITPVELAEIVEQLTIDLRDRTEPGEEADPQTLSVPLSTLTPADPTDFGSIVADPSNYGIPAAAEQFRTQSGYAIPGPTPGGSPAGIVPQNLLPFYSQQLTWSDCADYGASSLLECAYVIAPLDYSDPGGASIAIAISKRPATSATPQGSIIVNPGGPGSPGVALASAPYFDDLNQEFDIIGFDPRGVGASLPMIRCQSNDAWDRQRQGSDALTGDQHDSITEYNTNECYANTGATFGVDRFIDHVGTASVVKDLDIIRSVLGDPKINYIGFSYGTSIGYEYSRQFPDNIRALVMDGVVDVLENNPTEREKYAEYQVGTSQNGTIAQIAGFQATFEQFLMWCSATLGAECALVDPDDSNAPADLLERYQELARGAWGGQNYATYDGRPLSFADFNQGTIMAMYSADLWPALNAGLADIQADPTDDFFMITLADIYAGREDDGTYSLDLAAFPTIWCTDSGPEPGLNEDPAKQIEFLEEYYAAAPFTDPRTEAEPDRGMVATNDWCTYYEENFTLPTAESLRAMPNTLAIATTYDSATPFDQGVVAAAAMGGTLLIAAGNSHTSYGSSECVTKITNEYFTTLRVPTDLTGNSASTKDIHSNVVDGTECMVVADFRPQTELDSGVGEPGESIALAVNGLVRNSEYVVSWKYGSIAASSDVEGSATVTIEIPENAELGSHTLRLTPGIEGANDPTIYAEATLAVIQSSQAPDPAPSESAPNDTDADPDGSSDPEDSSPLPEDPEDSESAATESGSDSTSTLPEGELESTGVSIGRAAVIAVAFALIGGIGILITRRKSS